MCVPASSSEGAESYSQKVWRKAREEGQASLAAALWREFSANKTEGPGAPGVWLIGVWKGRAYWHMSAWRELWKLLSEVGTYGTVFRGKSCVMWPRGRMF